MPRLVCTAGQTRWHGSLIYPCYRPISWQLQSQVYLTQIPVKMSKNIQVSSYYCVRVFFKFTFHPLHCQSTDLVLWDVVSSGPHCLSVATMAELCQGKTAKILQQHKHTHTRKIRIHKQHVPLVLPSSFLWLISKCQNDCYKLFSVKPG